MDKPEKSTSRYDYTRNEPDGLDYENDGLDYEVITWLI